MTNNIYKNMQDNISCNGEPIPVVLLENSTI